MPISRLYQSGTDAEAAVRDLRASGIREGDIQSVGAEAGFVSATYLRRRGVDKARAAYFAEKVRAGAVLVMVTPPMGDAVIVEDVFAVVRPDDAGTPRPQYEGNQYDEEAPLSSALNLPVLLKDTAYFSKVLGLPLLSRNQRGAGSSLGFPTLTKGPLWLGAMMGPLLIREHKSSFGMPLLSHNPAPLSSLLKLPLLTRKR